MWGEISFTRFPLCLCVSFSDSHGDTAKRHQEESPQHKLKRCVKRSKSPPGIDVNDSLSQSDILAIDAVSADICLYCILSALSCIYDIDCQSQTVTLACVIALASRASCRR